jgi:hypothetical protein
MKMSPEHFNWLRTELSAWTPEAVANYRKLLRQEAKAKDIEKRLRWDLFWCIPYARRSPVLSEMNDLDLNDTHIDTALRRIVRELEAAESGREPT